MVTRAFVNVTVTTADGEVLERFMVTKEGVTEVKLASEIEEHVGKKFNMAEE